jgi:hypothetical protein
MIINVTDVQKKKMEFVQYYITFKNSSTMDKKAVIKQNVNTHIPLYDDVYGYLIGLDENGVHESPENVAEIQIVDNEINSRLFDKFTVVFIESSGHTCIETTTLFDVLLHITSNIYSSFVLYDNEDEKITETPKFIITK